MADGSVLIDTKLNTSPFEKGLASLGSLVSKSGLANVGAALLKGITAISAALTAAGGFAVQAGMNFDTAMSQVAATMGVTVDEITVLSDKAKEMGATTAFSATEAAEALNYLALAGYDAETAASVLPAVLNLAAAGGMDLAYASDLATDAMSALGIAANEENLTHFGDQMAKTASKANTSVSQLGEAILTVGGTAKSLAGGTVELNTALGVLANRGIKGAEGGTHLRNIILSLSAPTDTARKALKKLGIQVTDSAGNMRSLDDIMADFNKATEGMSETAKMDYLSKIFNKTDLAAVQALLAGCGEEWDSLEAEISDCEGAMADMAAVQLDNLEGDITILKSALEGLGIAAYEGVRDPLREIVQTGTGMIDQLSKAMTEGGFMGFASALGSVLSEAVTIIASYAPKVVSMAVSVIQSLVEGITKNAGTIGTAFVDVLSSISTGIMEITPLLIDAGANLFISLATGMAAELPSLLTTLTTSVTSMVSKIKAYLPQMLAAGKSLLASLGQGISENLPTIVQAAVDAALALTNAFFEIKTDLLVVGGQIIQAIGEGLIASLPALAEQLPTIISTMVDFFATKYETIATVGASLLSSLIAQLPEVITSIAEAIPQIVEGLTSRASEFTATIAEAGASLLNSLIDNLPAVMESISSAIPLILTTITTALTELLPTLAESATTFFGSLVTALSTTITLIGEALPGIITAIVTFVTENLPTIVETAETLFNAIVDAIPPLLTALAEQLPSALADDNADAVQGSSDPEPQGKVFGAADLLGDHVAHITPGDDGQRAGGQSAFL